MNSDYVPWNAHHFPNPPEIHSPACSSAESYWLHFLIKERGKIRPRRVSVFDLEVEAIEKTLNEQTLLVIASPTGELDGAILHPEQPNWPLRTLYDRPSVAEIATHSIGVLRITPERYIHDLELALNQAGIQVGCYFFSNINSFSRYLDELKRERLGL